MPKHTIGNITQLSTKESPIDWSKVTPTNIPGKIKQTIHFLSLKASSTDGYEQALKAITGKIVALTTTPQHLIVVTE